MPKQTLVRGAYVFTAADQPPVRDAALLIEDDRVKEVAPFAEARARHPDAELLGSPNAAILPGFINAHHHGQGVTSIQHGMPEDLLEPWLLSWAGTRSRDRYLDTLLSGAKLLGSGVTTTVDVWSDGSDASAYARSIRDAQLGYGHAGIRVCFAPGIKTQSFIVWGSGEDHSFLGSLPADLRPRAESLLPSRNLSEDDYFDVMAEIGRETADDPRFHLWFAFPGPQWVNDRFMQRIADAAVAADTCLQTHVNESIYEKLHGRRFYGRDTMLHLEALGILSPRFSIAHGCWLTELEIAAMSRTGAAVSHNPGSNLRLHAGIAPLHALRAAGVTVGLGMDSTTLNDDEDMFAEMRLALRINRDAVSGGGMSPADVFGLATLGGAKLLRQEDRLGRLAPGYAADLVVVDLARAMWPWAAPECDPLALCLLRAARRDVDLVMVGGEVVWHDGAPTRFDIGEAGRAFAERMAAEAAPAEGLETVRRLLPHLRAWYGAWEIPTPEPYVLYNSRI